VNDSSAKSHTVHESPPVSITTLVNVCPFFSYESVLQHLTNHPLPVQGPTHYDCLHRLDLPIRLPKESMRSCDAPETHRGAGVVLQRDIFQTVPRSAPTDQPYKVNRIDTSEREKRKKSVCVVLRRQPKGRVGDRTG